jgi:hypothetical protein
MKQKVLWFKTNNFCRFFVLVTALVLAAAGQFYWIQTANPQTLSIGSCYYFAAVLLWGWALGPWFKDKSTEITSVLPQEKLLFSLIVVIALFMRVYQLDILPPGLFVDQGYEGYGALRVLHEGWRPFYLEGFDNYALVVYMLAAWFWFFGATALTLKLFFVLISLFGLVFIYWTFRQLSGPRIALMALFVLAVMRWHINFSRNAFPSIQVPFYMFGTLGFLLWGAQQNKRWSFIAAALFFAGGFYTYQAYKLFPLLLAFYAVYEFVFRRKIFLANIKNIIWFVGLSTLLLLPMFYDVAVNNHWGDRETTVSILPQLKDTHSLKPFFRVLGDTVMMFNRKGDNDPRHNLPGHRMLDDISGILLVLGLFSSLLKVFWREYFYMLAGFFIMSLPCILSNDGAHANRMLGTTPFIAFIIATSLSTLWGQAVNWSGRLGEKIFMGLFGIFLVGMTVQNFNIYFNQQGSNLDCWKSYCVIGPALGEAIKEKGPEYDSFVIDGFNYQSDYGLKFYDYSNLSQLHPFSIPDSFVPLSTPANHGLFFGLASWSDDIVKTLKMLYPQGKLMWEMDPSGSPFLCFFDVPAAIWAQSKGLKAQFDGKLAVVLNDFPKRLPAGPSRAVFIGSLLVNDPGRYRLVNHGTGTVYWQVRGRPAQRWVEMGKGYVPIKVFWNEPFGAPSLNLEMIGDHGIIIPLNADHVTPLEVPEGILTGFK